jgi:uncharacterized membrane protein YqjE
MAAEDSGRGATRPRRAFDPFKRVLSGLVGAVQTRLELVVTDLEEAKDRLGEIILLALAAFFALSLGVVLLTIFIVAIFWETHRLLVLGGFVVLYIGLAAALALIVRKKISEKPRLFSNVLSELAKDRKHLQPDD